jgi:hypothetical protein
MTVATGQNRPVVLPTGGPWNRTRHASGGPAEPALAGGVPIRTIRSMVLRGVVAILVLESFALCAAAQTTSTQAAETWLQVTADEVYIRSRADTNSLPVARVPRDTLLRAVGRDAYGWYRIQPPPGVFSFVSAEYVDRRGPDTGIVSVRSGTLRVRVGSLVRDVDPGQTEVQALLAGGTLVKILGEQGPWLRIAPPAGVYVYVAAQHVRTISAAEAARVQAVPVSQPAPRAAAEPAPSVAEPDLSGHWGRRLVVIETAIGAEARKPLAEQSWSSALAELEPLAAQREEPVVARLAEAWMIQLRRRGVEQEVVRAAEELRQRTRREDTQLEREGQLIERAKQAATRPGLTARGQLRRSLALGARDGKRWYKLVDPLTGRMEAYLEIAAESKIDPEGFVGQYVGVRGARRAEAAFGADVVRVEEIVPLPAAGPAARPASQPTRQAP